MHREVSKTGWILLLDDFSNDIVSCSTAAGRAGGRQAGRSAFRSAIMCTYDLAGNDGAYRDGASWAVTVASGFVDQIPGKNGWVLAVLAPIDGVHSAGQHLYIVLVQLHHLWVCEEADMVRQAGPAHILIHTFHPVIYKGHDHLHRPGVQHHANDGLLKQTCLMSLVTSLHHVGVTLRH